MKIKSKKNKATEVETPVETVETPVENTQEAPTDTEIPVEDGEVSSERMHKVVELLQDEFDIRNKSFELTGYNDKGNKIEATLSNVEYEVKFTLRTNALMKLN